MIHNVGKDYDVLKFVDLRYKIERTIEKHIEGLEVTGGGSGFGGVDITFEYDKCRFQVHISSHKVIKE
jgi:hypothetical protein